MFKYILKKVFVIIALVIIVIEDTLWDITLAVTNRLDKYKMMQKLEIWMASLSSYQALSLFITPDILLLPSKFYIKALIHNDMYLKAVLVVIILKIVSTAIYSKIFMTCKPQLLQIRWFNWIYEKIVGLKNHFYDKIKNTEIYKSLQELKQGLRLKMLKIKESLKGKPGRFSRLKTFIRAKQKPA